MACQYQTVASTATWRVASWRERARKVERRDECGDAEEEMSGVRDGDEVEEVAARVGVEEDVLRGELRPGDPLTGEEECAESERGR